VDNCRSTGYNKLREWNYFFILRFKKKTPLKMEVFYSFPPLKDYWEQVGFLKNKFNTNIFLLSKSTKFKIIEQNFFYFS